MIQRAKRNVNPLRTLLAVLTVLTTNGWAAAAQQQSAIAPACRPDGPLVPVPNLVEGSGIAVSRSDPGRVWAHNDSGRPEIMSLSDRGAVLGGIQLTGASIDDWKPRQSGPARPDRASI